MKSNPALPGGSLTSKPMWSNAFGCSATSAFFVLGDDGNVNCSIVPSERSGVAMNGKELVERGLRRGIALWRIESEHEGGVCNHNAAIESIQGRTP